MTQVKYESFTTGDREAKVPPLPSRTYGPSLGDAPPCPSTLAALASLVIFAVLSYSHFRPEFSQLHQGGLPGPLGCQSNPIFSRSLTRHLLKITTWFPPHPAPLPLPPCLGLLSSCNEHQLVMYSINDLFICFQTQKVIMGVWVVGEQWVLEEREVGLICGKS